MLCILWYVTCCRREVPKKTRMTAPEVKVNTDEADVKKCAAHFESCGWDPLDFDPRYKITVMHCLHCDGLLARSTVILVYNSILQTL